MTKQALVIGIGAGNPEHISIAGAKALAQAEAIILFDKGIKDLDHIRMQIIKEYAPQAQIISLVDPPRDRNPKNYKEEVHRWHEARRALVIEAMAPFETIAFLVWGDPSLYDSTVRLLRPISDLSMSVFPGVTAVSALCAAYGLALNQVGKPIVISSTRSLDESIVWAREQGASVVVMLDGGHAWLSDVCSDLYIWWGAYVGMPEQCLIKGRVSEVGMDIARTKDALRAKFGWIMDIYILRV